MTTLRVPLENEPLERWLSSALEPIQSELTVELVRRSLGNEAGDAFAFDGIDFLLSFLEARAEQGPGVRAFVIDGVTEVATNASSDTSERRYEARDRYVAATTEVAQPPSATLEEALRAAVHFFLLARASLAKANFGGPERAADIALFETFRLASIAVFTDDTLSLDESALLLHIMGWHGGAAESRRDDGGEAPDLPAAFVNGLALVDDQLDAFAHHSLVMRITSSTTTVTERLRACALELIDATLRLDGANEDVVDSLVSIDAAQVELADDLAMIGDSLFIIPRGRGGHLHPDAKFDKLWALYRQAVPWSTPDRRGNRSP